MAVERVLNHIQHRGTEVLSSMWRMKKRKGLPFIRAAKRWLGRGSGFFLSTGFVVPGLLATFAVFPLFRGLERSKEKPKRSGTEKYTSL